SNSSRRRPTSTSPPRAPSCAPWSASPSSSRCGWAPRSSSRPSPSAASRRASAAAAPETWSARRGATAARRSRGSGGSGWAPASPPSCSRAWAPRPTTARSSTRSSCSPPRSSSAQPPCPRHGRSPSAPTPPWSRWVASRTPATCGAAAAPSIERARPKATGHPAGPDEGAPGARRRRTWVAPLDRSGSNRRRAPARDQARARRHHRDPARGKAEAAPPLQGPLPQRRLHHHGVRGLGADERLPPRRGDRHRHHAPRPPDRHRRRGRPPARRRRDARRACRGPRARARVPAPLHGRGGRVRLTRSLEASLALAIRDARARRHEFIGIEHLLRALLDDERVAEVVRACGGDGERLRHDLAAYLESHVERLPAGTDVPPQQTLGFQRVLQRAAAHVQSAGRDELDGPEVLGGGFAPRVHHGEAPTALKHVGVYALDMGALLAGTKSRGEFEARLKAAIGALKAKPGAVLFIDEIHTVVGAGATQGGSMDASNI